MSDRKCDMHGALEVSWDTADIPDLDSEPRCAICEMENDIIRQRQDIRELKKKVDRLSSRGIEDMKNTINTLEGTLENIQDDNVAKEGEIERLEAELESIQGRLATWQAVKDANATVCAERDEFRIALNEIMSYTKLGIGSIGRIRGIAGKALGGRKEQGTFLPNCKRKEKSGSRVLCGSLTCTAIECVKGCKCAEPESEQSNE